VFSGLCTHLGENGRHVGAHIRGGRRGALAEAHAGALVLGPELTAGLSAEELGRRVMRAEALQHWRRLGRDGLGGDAGDGLGRKSSRLFFRLVGES
jgi:hypothetical protein